MGIWMKNQFKIIIILVRRWIAKLQQNIRYNFCHCGRTLCNVHKSIPPVGHSILWFFLLKAFYWEACFVMTLKIFIFSSPYASRKSVERVEALTYKKHQTLSHYTRFISRSQQKSMEADSFTGARSWQLNASWCIFGLSSSKLVYMISLIQCLLLCNEFFFSKGQDHSKEIPDSFSHWIEYADSFCLSVTRICTAYYSCEFSFFLQVDKIIWIHVCVP